MRKLILVSDIDGAEIPDGTGATVTIRPADMRKSARELHVTDEQAESLGGRTVARRGRKAAAATTTGGRRGSPAAA